MWINKYINMFTVMVLGITIGEIGSKLGMNSTNNGFLAFNKVRIPRMHMLMKNAQVLKVRCNYLYVYIWSIFYSLIYFHKLKQFFL